MKIELKKVKSFRGHEGVGLNAEVWVDEVKTFYFIDEAGGGEPYHQQIWSREKYAALEKYAASLPKRPLWSEDDLVRYGREQEMMDVTIDDLVNELFDNIEKEKFKKKMEKKMTTHLMWGNENQYRELSWKGFTIDQMTTNHKGIVQKALRDLKEKYPNGELLNTNIPKELLCVIAD